MFCPIEPVLTRKSLLFILLGLLLLVKPTAITLAYDEQPQVLESGKPIERDLNGGESHSYQLKLLAGQYVRLFADQRRINVALAAFNPDGKKIIEADGFSMGNAERIMFIAETSGTYRVEVRSPDQTAHKGNYELKIGSLRAATEQDKSLVRCDGLMYEGLLIEQQPTAESFKKAIEKFQQSIPFCQAAKEPSWEATDYYLLVGAYTYLRDKQKALDFANQALPIAELAANQPGEEDRRLGIKVKANTFLFIAGIYSEFGDRKQALENLLKALPLSRSIDDPVGEVSALTSMGTAYNDIGDYPKALDAYSQSLVITRKLGDEGVEGNLLNNMCAVQSRLGDYKRSMELCSQALSIRREHKFQLGEATTLNNMGNIYSDSGEYQKALDFYSQAKDLYKVAGTPQAQAVTLNNIAFLYALMGDYQKAINVYNEALDIFRTVHDQYREAHVLGNVAATYGKLKEFRKALEINEQALALQRLVGNRASEANALTNIADCYSNLGEKQKALDYLNQSLALHRTIGDPRALAKSLRGLGVLYLDQGQHQKALDYFNEALELTRAINDRNADAATLSYLARLERDRGDLVQSKKRIEESLAAIESLRVSVKSQQLRASFVASVRKYYEFDIDVLMRLHQQHPSEGFDAAALAASEKSRARSLLEMLAEANAEIRQGVDPQLLERERYLRVAIADKAERQTRMLSAKHTDEQAKVAATEIDSLTTDYEQVVARIRETSPRYAGLTQPLPLDLKQIQTEVLDSDTVLLEYALGEERSFLWAVTQDSISSFELEKREVLEAAARRVYEVLTERNRLVKNETPEQRRLRLDRSDAEYASAARTLSDLLLQPVASQLGTKRLLIVGEGLLQYVPFGGLPVPNKADRPIVAEHEIINLPSASVMGVLRREMAGRKPAPKTLAVLADPVFQNDDPRIAGAVKNHPDALASDVSGSARDAGLEGFVRLRFTRQEADEIAKFATSEKRLEALDFVASRATATSPELGQYRILHFATHGLINNQNPELSGMVLSLVNEKGQPQNGFLRLYEIYNLKLGADLVVLSACQTALGKEVKGEGLGGLARGFMYAGAPRIVASLWQVDDRATAQLMKRFYEEMLGHGLRPAAALRAAQVSMQSDKRWTNPHYWAGFTLQGEWK
jgi:CHAT domain-containing protein/Tfp pilus assembly protein PilF